MKPLHNAVLYPLHSFTGAPSQEIVVQMYYHIKLLFPKDVFVDSPTVSREQNQWEILYITFLTVTLLYIQIKLDRLLHNTYCINYSTHQLESMKPLRRKGRPSLTESAMLDPSCMVTRTGNLFRTKNYLIKS